MRVWSWNHSRWRRLGIAAAVCAWTCGAQWPESSSPAASARGRAQPDGDSSAAGRVGLETVHGSGAEHVPEVGEGVAVLPGGHFGCDGCPDVCQPGQVVGGDGFLEPRDTLLVEMSGHPDRLFAAVRTIGIDVELRRLADAAAGLRDALVVPLLGPPPGLPDLDLHPGNVLFLGPAAQLPIQLVLVVRREATAAVHGHVRAARAEQSYQRQVEEAGLQVPQGDVDGRDGAVDSDRAGRRCGPPCSSPRWRRGRPRPTGRSRHRRVAAPRPRRSPPRRMCIRVPWRRPPWTWTTTMVVESQASVPSPSGASVATVYTAVSTRSTSGSLSAAVCGAITHPACPGAACHRGACPGPSPSGPGGSRRPGRCRL